MVVEVQWTLLVTLNALVDPRVDDANGQNKRTNLVLIIGVFSQVD